MDLVRIVFEFDGTLSLNNDLVLHESPVAIDWVRGTSLLVNGALLDLNNATQIKDNHFVVRLPSSAPIRVTHASTHFVFPKRYVVEVGQTNNTTFFTIFSKETEKFAVDLGCVVGVPKVTLENNLVVLTDDAVRFAYDPANNKVMEHKVFLHESAPIPHRFLRHILNRDFDGARALLAFAPSNEQLAGFFGDFGVLLNNYLGDENIVSIVVGDTTKNLEFEIAGGVIQNINHK